MNTSVTVGQPGSPGTEPGRQAGGAPLHRRLAGSPALRVVGRRLLVAIPVLWGVTFLTFVVLNALPGDAASALLGTNATPQQVRAFSIKLHLNEPLLVRYGHWLGAALHGDLGTSLYYNQSVTSILAQRLPVTIELVVYALVITFVVSVPLAVLSARRPRGGIDRASMALSMGGLSIAPYVLALLLILVFAVNLQWFPALAQGTGGDIRDLTLPAITLAIPLIGFYTRFLRADLLEQMQSEDYTVTAMAKGLSRWQVLTRQRTRAPACSETARSGSTPVARTSAGCACSARSRSTPWCRSSPSSVSLRTYRSTSPRWWPAACRPAGGRRCGPAACGPARRW